LTGVIFSHADWQSREQKVLLSFLNFPPLPHIPPAPALLCLLCLLCLVAPFGHHRVWLPPGQPLIGRGPAGRPDAERDEDVRDRRDVGVGVPLSQATGARGGAPDPPHHTQGALVLERVAGGLSSPFFFEPPFCQPPVLAIAFFCGHEFHMPALPCVQPPPQGEGTLAKMGDRHRLGPGESKGKARSRNPGAGCVRPGKNLKRKRAARFRSPREICDESKSGFVATFDLSRLLSSCAGGTKGP